MRQRIGSWTACLRSRLKAGYLIPDLESARTFPTVLLRFEPMPTRAEVLADWPAGSQETWGMAGRLEAAHRPRTLTRRLVRVFGAVVQPLMFEGLHARHDGLMGRLVAAEL